MHYDCNISEYLSYGIQTWHDLVDARFDNLDLDIRSKWSGRGKQYFTMAFKLRMVVDLCMTYIYACFDDLVLDFQNVCKDCPCYFWNWFVGFAVQKEMIILQFERWGHPLENWLCG